MRKLLLGMLAATILSFPAVASDTAINGAQSTIQAQIEAFLAGDDAGAYSHAAPNIRRIFPNQDAFMRMVREGYPAVHRPRSFTFGTGESDGAGAVVQRVELIGPDGRGYEAVYTLELQPDGRYLITGVHLRESQMIGT
ncbi:MAG: DUF4864 domain-containing protein [Rhizobiaceae bacterium]